jgi:(p)ppGpp synthase/HD superfamily hydrolase
MRQVHWACAHATDHIMDAISVVRAADFAAHKHRAQRRKDAARTPYINHPLRVAAVLACEAGVSDAVVLQAAILHDTVEDTDCTLAELTAVFGAHVAYAPLRTHTHTHTHTSNNNNPMHL